jgi:hypothetical protein
MIDRDAISRRRRGHRAMDARQAANIDRSKIPWIIL